MCRIYACIYFVSIWVCKILVLGKFLQRKFHLGKFHRENSSHEKFLLHGFGAGSLRSRSTAFQNSLLHCFSAQKNFEKKKNRIIKFSVGGIFNRGNFPQVEFSIGGIFHRRNFPGGTFLGGIYLAPQHIHHTYILVESYIL